LQPLKILIVDDHTVIRRALRSLLSSRPEWGVCGEAINGVEGVKRAKELKPDVVLMDLSMPEMGGLEATRLIQLDRPETKVIIVSQNEPAVSRTLAIANGALDFVAKTDLSRDLLKVIEDKCCGQTLAPVDLLVPEIQKPPEIGGPDWLSGGGDMGSAMRLKNWDDTALGPLQAWPQSLKVSAGICVSSRFDLIVWWGPELIMLYNDSYRRTLGVKHPKALGAPGRLVYPEIWDVIGPMLDNVMATGEATWSEDLLLLLDRNGYPEETYHTFSYTPVRDENGKVMGVITPVTETTDKVISERRLMTLRDLAARSVDAKSEAEAWEFAARALDGNPQDLPFAILYRLEKDSYSAVAWTGIKPDNSFLFQKAELSEQNRLASLLADVVRSGQCVEFNRLEEFPTSLPGGFWGISPAELCCLPIAQTGQERPMGILVAGVSRRKQLDHNYRSFFELVAGQIARSIADIRLLEEERKRAATLAELDRAKTVFFSNVSHELRTPLTLILSPLEDFLSRSNPDIVVSTSEVEVIHRNALRLLKLVNALLDFSRIEAGRIQATFEPVNIGQLTKDVASAFRSTMEKAGIDFEVQSDELGQDVFIDTQMWERIVLNLISNALKFTKKGSVSVRVSRVAENAVLTVSDTGVGIPEAELPRIFERFHRIEHSSGRTHEGTGIGLALVQELVRLHGGTISVRSVFGEGSCFTVSLPFGSAHLPQDRLVDPKDGRTPLTMLSKMFTDEAIGWLPENKTSVARSSPGKQERSWVGKKPRILLAEDNADMRSYVERLLLEQGFVVDTANDGRSALGKARTGHYSLVLSDVMMPELDGIGLLREIRKNAVTATLPVILLSARAGEEFKIQGLGAGADDYLVKPFSARELISRVKAHVEAEVRRSESEDRLKLALELGRIGTWDLDLPSEEAFWSSGLYSLLGYQIGECQPSNSSWAERIHPHDRERVLNAWQSAKEKRAEYHFEYRVVYPSLEIRWIEARGCFFYDENGQAYRDIGAAQDITSRKLAEQHLQKASEELKQQIEVQKIAIRRTRSEVDAQAQLLDLSNDAAFISDRDNRISYWNRGAERLYGWSQEEVLGLNASALLQTQFPVSFEEVVKALERSGRWEGELLQTTRYGLRMTVSSRWTSRKNAEGKIAGWLEINSDTTPQKRAEEAARRLSGRILQLQDEERRKLARELHDSLGQYLAALKINSSGCIKRTSDPKVQAVLTDSLEIIEQCISETRTMSYLLHPPLLDESGLLSAIRWLTEGFGKRSGITVTLTAPAEMPRFSQDIETAIFRILQESLSNAHRHSGTDKVDVELKAATHTILLTVRDYGRGIEEEQSVLVTRNVTGGVGLAGMRERARELGGTLNVQPDKTGGTVVSLEMPIGGDVYTVPSPEASPKNGELPSRQFARDQKSLAQE
jgi:PAS domain S-box-containing protein